MSEVKASEESKPADADFALSLINVGVLRGGRWILEGVNWSVRRGTMAAILGPNGSGKSTLARVIGGYVWPSRGRVAVGGRWFGECDLNDLRRTIRLVQAAGPYDVDPELTARQAVLTGLFGTIGLFDQTSRKDEFRADQWLDRVGLGGLAEHRYSTLSSGERVRCLIARALIAEPELLLLDEPTAGLDFVARERVLATLEELFGGGGHTRGHAASAVMITHHTEELPTAVSHVVLLAGGRVVNCGAPVEVLRGDVLSAAYGWPLHVDRVDGRYFTRASAGAFRGDREVSQ